MNATLLRKPPAPPVAIDRLHRVSVNLPEPYLRFLERSNGAEGDLGVEPGWFVVWAAEEAVSATQEYEVPASLLGYFAFGGNGGGELLVFALSEGNMDRPVFMVPAIGMAPRELRQVAPSFVAFETEMGRCLT